MNEATKVDAQSGSAAVWFRIAASVAVVCFLSAIGTPRLRAAILNSFDLATLYKKAELVALVEDFQPREKNAPGAGVVRKVFKGEYPLGKSIKVLPWGVDFDRVSGLPGGRLPRPFDAVFFLVKQADHLSWETTLSGVRIIIEDRIYGVSPAAPHTYVIVPTSGELLEGGSPYDREAFQRDLSETPDRILAVRDALLLRPNEDGLKQFRSVLDAELQRSFRDATRSTLVLELANRLVELSQVETLWKLRNRVPRTSMGREVDQLFARVASHEFLDAMLQGAAGPGELDQVFDFLQTESFSLDIEVQRRTLKSLVELSGTYAEAVRPRAYQTTASLLKTLPVSISETLLSKIIHLAKYGHRFERFYLLPALLERYPRDAAEHIDEPLRLFALVTVNQHDRRQLAGKVEVKRLTSPLSFHQPRLVFERVTTDKSVMEHYSRAFPLPTRALASGKSGTFLNGFSWDFSNQPLGRGDWRIFLEITCTDLEKRGAWQTDYTEFRVQY